MGFRLQQKLMTLNVNSLLCHQSYACLTKRLRLESRGFHCKVALHHTYPHILSSMTKLTGVPLIWGFKVG